MGNILRQDAGIFVPTGKTLCLDLIVEDQQSALMGQEGPCQDLSPPVGVVAVEVTVVSMGCGRSLDPFEEGLGFGDRWLAGRQPAKYGPLLGILGWLDLAADCWPTKHKMEKPRRREFVENPGGGPGGVGPTGFLAGPGWPENMQNPTNPAGLYFFQPKH